MTRNNMLAKVFASTLTPLMGDQLCRNQIQLEAGNKQQS
jgi:hypothetical protein